MSETSYEVCYTRLDYFDKAIKNVTEDKLDSNGKYYEDIWPPMMHIIEIDLFKKEFPDTFLLYLDFFHDWYSMLLSDMELMESEIELYNDFDKKQRLSNPVNVLVSWLDIIVTHIEKIIQPENEIEEPITKVEKIKPFEKILIFHYLNEKKELLKYPLNSKSGKYFLSRLLDINPESIKNPVANISDYTMNKVTEKQAEPLFKTLEKVKSFFDNSDLTEISKVIETRINELKRISGKD